MSAARLAWLLGAAVAAACGAPEPPPTPATGARAVTILLPSDVLSLDPNQDVEGVTDSVLFNVFEPLVAFDANLQVRPVLAERWENPSPERWRFRLRRGVRFHDGSALTAESVRAALSALQRSPHLEAAQALNQIREVHAPDADTVEIVTREPRAILSSLPFLYVTKPNQPGGFPPWIGTGPYRIREREVGRRVRLQAWEEWRGDPPQVHEATFETVRDEAQRVERVARGQADLAYGITAELSGRARPGMRFVRQPGLTVVYLGFNLRPQPGNAFRDVRVRQAFHLAIDREALIHRSLSGAGLVATQPVAPLVFGYEPGLGAPPHDPAAAARLLEQAGVKKGQRMRLDFLASRGPVARVLQEQLAPLGLVLELNPLPADALYALGKSGRSDLFLMGWNCTSGEAGEFYEFCLHTPQGGYGSANYGAYSNGRIDHVAQTHAALLDQRQRQLLLREAATIAMAELPVVPLYVEDDIYAVRDGIVFTPRPDSQIRLLDVKSGR